MADFSDHIIDVGIFKLNAAYDLWAEAVYCRRVC